VGRRSSQLAAVLIGAMALTAIPAQAAEVSVGPGPFVVPPSYTLEIAAAAGEANTIAITAAAPSGGNVTYTVRDASTPPTPGAGCATGAPGEVQCTLPQSRASSGCIGHAPCADPGANVGLDLALGDADDSVDLSTLPASDGGTGQFTTRVNAGAGDDTIVGSPATDILDPGPGADSVSSGAGNDSADARSGGPDGPDRLDLGAGYDSLSYEDATEGVTISVDGVADDGAPGEGDNVAGAEVVDGGPGDDTIIGADVAQPHPDFALLIYGHGGADRIVGGPGPDFIEGGSLEDGDNVIDGAGGNDFLVGASGDDVLDGGPGNDGLRGFSGADRLRGAAGRDEITGDGGADQLFGNGAADLLFAAGGGADRVACGGGTDRATLDSRDTERGCER
jgi:Ca2+-binding RTX toxin-like protein